MNTISDLFLITWNKEGGSVCSLNALLSYHLLHLIKENPFLIGDGLGNLLRSQKMAAVAKCVSWCYLGTSNTTGAQIVKKQWMKRREHRHIKDFMYYNVWFPEHNLPKTENISADCNIKPNQRQHPPKDMWLKPIWRLAVISPLCLLSATLRNVTEALCDSNTSNWNGILSNVNRQAQRD